jgi:hypothetical protein
MNPSEASCNPWVKLLTDWSWPIVVLIVFASLRTELQGLLRRVENSLSRLSLPGGFALDLQNIEQATENQKEKLSSSTVTPEEAARNRRILEVAKSSAEKFIYWMTKYNHRNFEGDSMRLLDWLVADRGARYLSENYDVFKMMAFILAESGYHTIPVPSEDEFNQKCKESRLADKALMA